jgi:hypothetical protein
MISFTFESTFRFRQLHQVLEEGSSRCDVE